MIKKYECHVIEEAKNNGQYLFVYVADLSGLKHLNDAYGHAAGDEAIAAISQKLTKVAPKGSRIVRTGVMSFLCLHQ